MDQPPPTGPVIVSNNKTVILWVFMAVWLAMLGCFTYLFWRDGGDPELGGFGVVILAAFWLAGLGALSWAFGHPRIRVTVAGNEVVARESWLWGHSERRFAAAEVAAPAIVQSIDSDGDAYFSCQLTLPGGGTLSVAESHLRRQVEAVQQRLSSALQQAGAQAPG